MNRRLGTCRTGWPMLVLVAGVLACSGGLDLDRGYPYPCDFNRGSAQSSTQCPSGWVCGVANSCVKVVDEGVPAGLLKPTPSTPLRVLPTFLTEPIVSVAADPTGTRFLVGYDAIPDAGIAAGSVAINHLSVSTTDAGTLLRLPAMDEAAFGTKDPDGGMNAVLRSGNTALLVDFEEPAPGVPLYLGGPPVTTSAIAQPVQQVRAHALDPFHASEVEFVVPGGTGIGTMDMAGNTVTATSAKPPTAITDDIRPFPYPYPGGFGLVAATNADQPAGSIQFYDPGTDTWATAPQLALSQAATLPFPPRLAVSPDGRAMAYVYLPGGLSTTSDAPETMLRTWSIAVGPAFTEAWGECAPCPGQQVFAFAPFAVGGLSVQVLCRDATGHTTLFDVVGSNGAGRCEGVDLLAPIDLDEISSVDTAAGGRIAAGGKHGELWLGTDFTQLQPVFLDRPANDVGAAFSYAPDGGIGPTPVLFTANGIFVPASNNGFANVRFLGGAPPNSADHLPVAYVHGTVGWFLNSNGDVLLIDATVLTGGHPLERFGPRLLGPNGAPAQGPFGGAGCQTGALIDQPLPDGGLQLVQVGPAGTLVLTADDSLYSWDVDPSELASAPQPGDGVYPKLTPEPGFPIRSLALVPSDGGSEIHGYVATSNSVFSVAYAGAPAHWTAEPIVLPSDEPVAVWTAGDGTGHGRVGYRDGTIYTLPGAFPLTQPLPEADGGRADRVLEYGDVGGWPVAHTENALYIAARPAGSDGGVNEVLSWEPFLDTSQQAALQDIGSRYQLISTSIALYLFGQHGYTYRIDLAPPQSP